VVITGCLLQPAEMRYSPAGIPIARALLEHESEQEEAGVKRWIRFRVGIRASGAPIAEQLTELEVGAKIKVAGMLLRSRQPDADTHPLIISIGRLERLPTDS